MSAAADGAVQLLCCWTLYVCRRVGARRPASSIPARQVLSQPQLVLREWRGRRLDEGPIKSSYTFSIRIAVALNSEVPDLGSTASIVRSLVATSSCAWTDKNASPGRSAVSKRTGATTVPLRDVTRTRSPSCSMYCRPSSGETSSAVARLRGEAYFPVCTPVL